MDRTYKEEAQSPDFYDNNCILWSEGFGLQAHLNTSPRKREEIVRAKKIPASQNVRQTFAVAEIGQKWIISVSVCDKLKLSVRWRTLCYAGRRKGRKIDQL